MNLNTKNLAQFSELFSQSKGRIFFCPWQAFQSVYVSVQNVFVIGGKNSSIRLAVHCSDLKAQTLLNLKFVHLH